MQKKLIALAVAGLMAAPAFAQSNVTVYGRVDYGFMSRNGNSGDVDGVNGKTELAPGIQGGSRVGFKGAEDLGNGLKALFELEFGSIKNDSTTGLTGNRHAYVGLTGGFGTVVGGRLDGVRYGVYGKYDPFGNGTVGNITQITPQVDRADNAIAYISPDFAGFGLVLAYSTDVAGVEGSHCSHATSTTTTDSGGDTTTTAGTAVGRNATDTCGNAGDNRLQTAMLTYNNGPISAALDYEQIKTQGAGDHNTLIVNTAAVSYDFGVVKVSGLYDVVRSNKNNAVLGKWKTHNWLVGAKAPIGSNVVLKAAYGHVKDKINDKADISKWGVGMDYMLSKRTNFYLDYGSIQNDKNADVQLSEAGSGFGGGYGTRGIDLGIAHKF